MKGKIYRTTALILVLATSAVCSDAAVFDFAYIADNQGEKGYSEYIQTENGIALTAIGLFNPNLTPNCPNPADYYSILLIYIRRAPGFCV